MWCVSSHLLIFKKPSLFHFKCLLPRNWKEMFFGSFQDNALNSATNQLLSLDSKKNWVKNTNEKLKVIIRVALCLAPLKIMPLTRPRCQNNIHSSQMERKQQNQIFSLANISSQKIPPATFMNLKTWFSNLKLMLKLNLAD